MWVNKILFTPQKKFSVRNFFIKTPAAQAGAKIFSVTGAVYQTRKIFSTWKLFLSPACDRIPAEIFWR